MPKKVSKHFHKVYGYHLCIFVDAAKKGSHVVWVGLEFPTLLRITFSHARITRMDHSTSRVCLREGCLR